MEQISIQDIYGMPDFHGSRDEIVRYSIEQDFENRITLIGCCHKRPVEMFKSSSEYFVRCKECGKQTRTYKHMYEAKQAWNRGEYDNNRNQKQNKDDD